MCWSLYGRDSIHESEVMVPLLPPVAFSPGEMVIIALIIVSLIITVWRR
jgi:hypothetical protein